MFLPHSGGDLFTRLTLANDRSLLRSIRRLSQLPLGQLVMGSPNTMAFKFCCEPGLVPPRIHHDLV